MYPHFYPVSSVKEHNRKGGKCKISPVLQSPVSCTHPPKLKEVRKVLPQVTGVPVHLPSLRASHGPSGLYNDSKRSEADGPDKGNQTSPVHGRLAYQSPVSGRSTSENSNSGRSDPVLRVDNRSGEILTETYSSVFVRGLRIPSRFSPCKIYSRKMAQTSGFDPTTQVKTCFDCKQPAKFAVALWPGAPPLLS